MFTLDDLQSLRGLTGVYFLYNDKKELVYIGKSTNMYSRILEHKFENKKDFSYFKAACSNSLTFVEIMEIYIIDRLRTKYILLNKRFIETSFDNFYFHLPAEIKKGMPMNSILKAYDKIINFVCVDNNDFNRLFNPTSNTKKEL